MDPYVHWLMDFIGVNNGDNSFSTHMYNFWSGFGGNISVLALGGAVFGVYRHNLRRISKLNPIHRRSHRRQLVSSDGDVVDPSEDDLSPGGD